MSAFSSRALPELLSFIVDNRGRSCPTAESGFPLIATNCLREGHRYPTFENIRHVSEATRQSWFRAHPEPGDVLFVCKGSPGRVAVVPDPVPFCIAQDMVALRANPELVHPGYLYYRLKSPDVQQTIPNLHVGTMIPHFKKGDFGKLRFDVHDDLSEQRAIAEVLGALDDKIAANANVVATADALAKALTRSALTGEAQPLSEIAAITMGSSPPGTSYNKDGAGTVFYQGVRDFGVRHPANRVWTDAPVRFARAKDTLLSVRAPVGRTNLASEETCIGRGLASARSHDSRPMTLFHVLRDSPDAWAPFEAEGTVFGSINKQQLAALLVPVVDPNVADSLEKDLAALEARIASALTENDELAATRDLLLPQLISGKIRVRDPERVVEGVV